MIYAPQPGSGSSPATACNRSTVAARTFRSGVSHAGRVLLGESRPAGGERRRGPPSRCLLDRGPRASRRSAASRSRPASRPPGARARDRRCRARAIRDAALEVLREHLGDLWDGERVAQRLFPFRGIGRGNGDPHAARLTREPNSSISACSIRGCAPRKSGHRQLTTLPTRGASPGSP